jgi:integrase/recombinase XerD
MQSKSTFSNLFWTYTARSKINKTNIYVKITVNGQKSKGNSVESRTVNLYLDEVKADKFQCYRDLKQEGKVLTANLIKSRYLGEDIHLLYHH